MIDELNELRRGNRVWPELLSEAVAIDRETLLEILHADSSDRQAFSSRPRLLVVGGRRPRSQPSTRAGYVAAMVAAAAALLAVAMIGRGGNLGDPAPVDVADDQADRDDRNQELDQDLAIPPGLTSTVPQLIVTDTDSDTDTSTYKLNVGEAATASVPEQPPASDSAQTSVGTTPATASTATVEGPFNPSTDLLVLHYDHASRDDGHAAVAALEIATTLGLTPHVVAGTYRDDHEGYVADFAPVMRAAWGDNWLNAYAERPTAVDQSVDRWLSTLDVGGQVWVAEGGVSDFTAAVVREVQRRRPNLETTTAIQVVQHNNRNESDSGPDSVPFLKANVAYQRIDDGNSANDTADLRERSERFETVALAGQHREAWEVAFDYKSADELDFSDTVEVLHILGITVDEVADPGDFADRFMDRG